jgi:hypothetical protein
LVFSQDYRRHQGSVGSQVNRALDRKGRVWQAESFDHVLRSSESLDEKIGYVLENPVRKGLVDRWEDYPWTWCKQVRNPFSR